MNKMIAYITKNIDELKMCQIPTISKPINLIGICPKCGKNVIETEKALCCIGTKNKECNFTLWKDDKFFKTFGKKLTETIVKELVNKGKVTVKGLKSTKKENVKFDAVVHLLENKETGYWNYKLDFDNVPKTKKKFNKNRY